MIFKPIATKTKLFGLALVLFFWTAVCPAQERFVENYTNSNITLLKKLSDGESMLIGDSDDWDFNDTDTVRWRFFVLSDAPFTSKEDRFEEAKKSLFLRLYSQRDNSYSAPAAPIARVRQSKTRVSSIAYGYYFPEGRTVNDNRPNLFANINQDFKNTLGENVYNKIYTSYVDLKRIDASVRSVISEYGLNSRYFEDRQNKSIDDGLRANLTLNQSLTVNSLDSYGASTRVDQALNLLNESKKTADNPEEIKATENNSQDRFFVSLVHSFNTFNISITLALGLCIFGFSKLFKLLTKHK